MGLFSWFSSKTAQPQPPPTADDSADSSRHTESRPRQTAPPRPAEKQTAKPRAVNRQTATPRPVSKQTAKARNLISAAGRAALERIGREEYGPPYPGPRPRMVTPSGADYYLHATEVLGTNPVPDGGPEWTAYEDTMCAELLEAVEAAGGGWAWGGALVVAGDMQPRSRNPQYLDVLDQALAFLHRSGVPPAFIPGFALDRWFETNLSVRFGSTD